MSSSPPNEDPPNLIAQVEDFVKAYMSHHDASHDYNHIIRVVNLARHIHAQEESRNLHPHDDAKAPAPGYKYNGYLIHLAALMHDVGDKKYLATATAAAAAAAAAAEHADPTTTLVYDSLMAMGSSRHTAAAVQGIVSHVSYSTETSDPDAVRGALDTWPELAVVQDADRLDALGAIGIARCFAYTSAVGRSLQDARLHMTEKLCRLGHLIKTATGRDLCDERLARVKLLMQWWDDEISFQSWEEATHTK
jgi:uncharacterized protein